MENTVCTWGCGTCARCRIDAAAAECEVNRRGGRTSRPSEAEIVAVARRAARAGGTLAGVAMDLRRSEKTVERVLDRAGEHELVSMLRPRGRARLANRDAGSGGVTPPRTAGSGYVGQGRPGGGRWLAPPSGDGLDAWRAARARRAAFLAAATRPARPVLPVVEELPAGTVMSDALLAELAAREQARARKAAGL